VYGRFLWASADDGRDTRREMLNPLPLVTVQIMAATVEVHRNGPTPVVSP
jgi:hypothetical protein